MKMRWIDNEPLGSIGGYVKSFFRYSATELISNVETTCKVLRISDALYFPVTVNNTEWNSSFVCSPFTAYALYSKDELLHKVKNRWVQLPLLALIWGIGVLLKWGRLNKNVHVNNFLLSTNPYPNWEGEGIADMTTFLKGEFPAHAIIFRSLNTYQHNELLAQFKNARYRLIGSRQVYMYDQPLEQWKKRNNNYQDLRVIKKKGLVYLSHLEMEPYLEQALVLYQKLYLEKYSIYNPQFTLLYFKEMYKNGSIVFQGYRDVKGELKAFSGIFGVDDTLTSPLVGYDTDAPQKDALYIHAIQTIFRYKYQTGKVLNLSSGAPHFKRMRGGVPAIEYSAIYTAHLKWSRRLTWKVLEWVSNTIGVPLLKKYEL